MTCATPQKMNLHKHRVAEEAHYTGALWVATLAFVARKVRLEKTFQKVV